MSHCCRSRPSCTLLQEEGRTAAESPFGSAAGAAPSPTVPAASLPSASLLLTPVLPGVGIPGSLCQTSRNAPAKMRGADWVEGLRQPLASSGASHPAAQMSRAAHGLPFHTLSLPLCLGSRSVPACSWDGSAAARGAPGTHVFSFSFWECSQSRLEQSRCSRSFFGLS